MECGRCSLPGTLRDIEDEAMAPWVNFAAQVENTMKGSSVYMSGDTGGHPASAIRSKEVWQKANAILNSLEDPEIDNGSCFCGAGILDHMDKEKIRYCHFGYHTVDCTKGASHAGR
jgi:hypothetical protein